MKESTMATIKDIAAKLNEGCWYSEVSKALGISKSTVSKYANRIKQSNLTLAQASECQEQELEETVRVPIERETETSMQRRSLGNSRTLNMQPGSFCMNTTSLRTPKLLAPYATFVVGWKS